MNTTKNNIYGRPLVDGVFDAHDLEDTPAERLVGFIKLHQRPGGPGIKQLVERYGAHQLCDVIDPAGWREDVDGVLATVEPGLGPRDEGALAAPTLLHTLQDWFLLAWAVGVHGKCPDLYEKLREELFGLVDYAKARSACWAGLGPYARCQWLLWVKTEDVLLRLHAGAVWHAVEEDG